MTQREKNLKVLAQMRLMDDDFMTQVFDNNIPAATLLLNVILRRTDMIVTEVVAQREYKSAEGRSVSLDIYAKDSSDKVYDIEVQRADRGASPRRARFHSSMMDTKLLKKGEDFSKLVDSYVIFITENDVIGENLPLYHVNRRVEETGAVFGDGTHIIYVNGEYRDEKDPVGKLMHDFCCIHAKDMHYPTLAEKVRYFKESEGGIEAMCRLMEELMEDRINEERMKVQTEERKMFARKLLNHGNMTYEEIAALCELPLEEVEALASEKTA